MPRRLLQPIAVPEDGPVEALLPALRAALSGAGPALLPVTGTPPPAAELTADQDDPTDPTALAVTTSGSTGTAKQVLLPASALLASVAGSHRRLGGPGHWLLALPVQHVAGLQVLVRSLVAGTRPVALDLRAGFDPERFAVAAGELPTGRRYTSLVPTQLARLLAAGAGAREALLRFDAVLLGGAAAPPELLARAAAAGVRVVTTYGASETCGGCVYDGVPLDGVQLELATDGRIEIAGLLLARGYRWPDGGSQPAGVPGRSSFRTGADGRRWFRTDDLGVLVGGRLEVTGRADEMVITGGVNVAPAAVEAALAQLPGIAEAVVLGLPDAEWGERLAAVIVLAPGGRAPDLSEMRAHVAGLVAPAAAPRQLSVVAALPLRGPGKPDRGALRQALLRGELGEAG